MKRTPITRDREVWSYPNGDRRVIQYGRGSGVFFANAQGVLSLAYPQTIVESQATVGDIFLRDKTVVSVGFRKDSDPHKFIGFRPDYDQAGGEQLEFTLREIQFDGAIQPIDLSQNVRINDFTYDLGSLFVVSTRKETRQIFKSSAQEHFRIEYLVNLEGFSVQQTITGAFAICNQRNQVVTRIELPQIVDLSTFEPIGTNLITHSLVRVRDNVYKYVKESTPEFKDAILPFQFGIDAFVAYSSTSDGRVYSSSLNPGASWAAVLSGSNLTVDNTSDKLQNAIAGNYITTAPGGYYASVPFTYFDFSGISSRDLSLYEVYFLALSYPASTYRPIVYLREGTQGDPLTTGDWNAWDSTDLSEGYTWQNFNVTGTNTNAVPFNDIGKTLLESKLGASFRLAVVEYHVATGIQPGWIGYVSGMYFAESVFPPHIMFIGTRQRLISIA